MNSGSQGWRNGHAWGGPGLFPPEVVVQVKALACELPARQGQSARALERRGHRGGNAAERVGGHDQRQHGLAVAPCGCHPPLAAPMLDLPAGSRLRGQGRADLDLYERQWEGHPLRDDEFVLSADEKTSIQARVRCHATRAPQPGQPMKVEHEYDRGGALAYVAALDVHRAKLFGRCEPKSGIAPFDRLVAQVMAVPPYAEARRVFWIVDNGSSHRGPRAVARLQAQHPRLVLVHGPVHASWLNQIEIYFSVVQRKVLTPNDFLRDQRKLAPLYYRPKLLGCPRGRSPHRTLPDSSAQNVKRVLLVSSTK